jgi:hypothetical protein
MFRVKNEKVIFTIEKNGQVIQKFDIKNRLTNLYLDYVNFRMLPTSITATLYPDFDELDNVVPIFDYAYTKFINTQVITDTSTTMDYDIKSLALMVSDISVITGTNNKTMITNYLIDFSTVVNGSLFTGMGFGRDDTFETNYLLAFIDLSLLGLVYDSTLTYGITRVDEIVSNEISTSGDYLPFSSGAEYTGKLNKIKVYYELNGTGNDEEYNVSDLTFTQVSTGIVEITGFTNFYISSTALYPSTTLYPSDTLYPIQLGQVKSVAFEYIMNDLSLRTTYLNMELLDITYQDTTFTIKLKCERGEY